MSTTQPLRWLVIGGDAPGTYIQWSTPPLPIAVQCLSTDEARTIQRTLHPLIGSQPQQPTSSKLLRILGNLRAVVDLLSGDFDGFYLVVVGTRVGIHCMRAEAAVTQGSFSFPRWRHTGTFWEVLAYMIIKGVEEHMPPLIIPDDPPAGSIGHASIDDSLSQTFEHSLHINGTHSWQSRDPSLGLSSTPVSPLSRSGTSSHSITYTDQGTTSLTPGGSTQMSTPPSDGTPIIYSHVQSLHGVIQSHYLSPVPRSTNFDLDTEPLGAYGSAGGDQSPPETSMEDYVVDQVGGGHRQPSPPPVAMPTKLRTHIKATVHDSGLVQQAEGPVLLALDSQTRAQQNNHLTQSTTQHLHTAIPSSPQHLPIRTPTPNTTTVGSSELLFGPLDGPHPNRSPSNVPPNVPQTRVIPPTPANIASSSSLLVDDVNPGFVPTGVEMSDEWPVNDWDMLTPSEETPSTPMSGRRSAEVNRVLSCSFEKLEIIMTNLATQTSLSTSQVIEGWHKSHSRIINSMNHWNLYSKYFVKHDAQEH
ncbi:hypothetical protein BDN67DRAFT_1014276 [Paxillus ammoniavirescens]|nr:hypothetical protein BDN67DRAFT_1014276 [Paxillus ammoniavirescens]